MKKQFIDELNLKTMWFFNETFLKKQNFTRLKWQLHKFMI